MKVGDTFFARDKHGVIKNWFVLEIEQDETHGSLAQCCLFYHRDTKWIKHEKSKKQIMRPIEYFTEDERIINNETTKPTS